MSERIAPTRTPAFEARLKKRYASERRFRALGLSAILFSIAVLVFLLGTMTFNGIAQGWITDRACEVLREAGARHCLVNLSRGGSDATEAREFDLPSATFVEDGFHLPEAKSSVAWVDADSLLVGTDVGADEVDEAEHDDVDHRRDGQQRVGGEDILRQQQRRLCHPIPQCGCRHLCQGQRVASAWP
mgnify:CR=1 FL=1